MTCGFLISHCSLATAACRLLWVKTRSRLRFLTLAVIASKKAVIAWDLVSGIWCLRCGTTVRMCDVSVRAQRDFLTLSDFESFFFVLSSHPYLFIFSLLALHLLTNFLFADCIFLGLLNYCLHVCVSAYLTLRSFP